MISSHLLKQISAAVLGTCLLAPVATIAADNTKTMPAPAVVTPAPMTPMSPADRAAYSDREQRKMWNSEKEQLEKALGVGQDKASYTKALADQGYQITSINADRPTYVEYEIVKGSHTYELQIDLDKATGKSTKIDVSTNVWRTAGTKAALKGTKGTMASKYEPANDAYSDRAHMKAWTTEKDKLEKQLALGHDKAYYADQLKKMGYQVTSTNDNEKDYLEYEVVKGHDSYEVQIDFDGGKAKKVDVTTNMWQSDATERALGQKH